MIDFSDWKLITIQNRNEQTQFIKKNVLTPDHRGLLLLLINKRVLSEL